MLQLKHELFLTSANPKLHLKTHSLSHTHQLNVEGVIISVCSKIKGQGQGLYTTASMIYTIHDSVNMWPCRQSTHPYSFAQVACLSLHFINDRVDVGEQQLSVCHVAQYHSHVEQVKEHKPNDGVYHQDIAQHLFRQ